MDEPVQVDAEGYVVEYDLEARLLGRRHLLVAKDNEPGYTTIPVEG